MSTSVHISIRDGMASVDVKGEAIGTFPQPVVVALKRAVENLPDRLVGDLIRAATDVAKYRSQQRGDA